MVVEDGGRVEEGNGGERGEGGGWGGGGGGGGEGGWGKGWRRRMGRWRRRMGGGGGRGGEGGIVPVNMPPSISLSLISGTPIKTLSHCNQCTRVLFRV